MPAQYLPWGVSSIDEYRMMKPPDLPAIHGHRGARGLYPENSLVSIRAALDMGCDAVEVDLCVTRDDRIVVLHDPILSPDIVRTPDGSWITEEIITRQTLYRDLQRYDIGRIRPESRYAERFSDQSPVDGATIPTLESFIELVLDQSEDVIFNLELKSTPYQQHATPPVDDFARLVGSIVSRYGIENRSFVQSFDWRMPIAVKHNLPDVKIGFTTDLQPDGIPIFSVQGKPSPWTNHQILDDFGNSIPKMIKSLGADVWSSNHLDMDGRLLQESRDYGLEVYVWTANSINDMERMISLGVDAITTDYPDRLKELLRE